MRSLASSLDYARSDSPPSRPAGDDATYRVWREFSQSPQALDVTR